MFNEYVILHTPPNISEAQTNKNISQVEKTTQTGDGNIWKVQKKTTNSIISYNMFIYNG